MIRAKIQIEDGLSKDTFNEWGLIYKVGDRRFSPPEKKIDEVSYPEEQGVHIDERTVYDKFDYTVSFIISGSYGIANDKIQAFNKAIREESSSLGVHRCKKITLYDYYKRCKIVGYPQLLEEVKEGDYKRCKGQDDFVIVDLTINVVNPSLCDFNLLVPGESDNVDLSLYIDDSGQLQWSTSRDLKDNEFVTLLTCGRKRARYNWSGSQIQSLFVNNKATSLRLTSSNTLRLNEVFPDFVSRKKSRNKWHVVSQQELVKLGSGDAVKGLREHFLDTYTRWKAKKTGKYYCLQIKKAPNSFFTLPNIKDVNGKICYALAVYRRDYDIRREKWGAQYRISNVSYFYSNVKINDNDTYTQWLSTY